MTLRALGGAELVGNVLSRTAYFDEAGISKLEHEPIVVVAGIILNNDKQWRVLHEHFDSLVKRFCPDLDPEGFIFHAHEIWHGQTDSYWDRDACEKRGLDRRDVLHALCDTLTSFDAAVVFGQVDRRTAGKLFLENDGIAAPPERVTTASYTAAFAIAATHANTWMNTYAEPDECLNLIVEDSGRLKKYAKGAFKSLRKRTPDPLLAKWLTLPISRIVDAPGFMDKEEAPPLQLADFCAFMLKRWLMEKPDVDQYITKLLPSVIASLPPDRYQKTIDALSKSKKTHD